MFRLHLVSKIDLHLILDWHWSFGSRICLRIIVTRSSWLNCALRGHEACLFGNISILASMMSSMRTLHHNVRIRPVRKLTNWLVWDPLFVQSPAWGTHSFSLLFCLICFWNLKIGCFKRGAVLSSKAGKTADERKYVRVINPSWLSNCPPEFLLLLLLLFIAFGLSRGLCEQWENKKFEKEEKDDKQPAGEEGGRH